MTQDKLKEALGLKCNGKRLSDRQVKHIGEHIDAAMVELAYAANICAEYIKTQCKTKRKDDPR